MTHFVMKLVRFESTGAWLPDNTYLKSMDFEAFNGRGHAVFTHDLQEAMKFDSTEAVLSYWKTQSKTVPLREDGEPNRPLTASTVEVIGVER